MEKCWICGGKIKPEDEIAFLDLRIRETEAPTSKKIKIVHRKCLAKIFDP